eukprot:TRINITY_DN9327_c0_g1_i1.p1 TRINITY_DN9327_c0_g1~~TRINITY_DN9327_c0_g1_i1.p1  ORF type:complete len:1302 (+),score=142.95 TRINITY_DN9327_c0_g1_i1:73-3978(+)
MAMAAPKLSQQGSAPSGPKLAVLPRIAAPRPPVVIPFVPLRSAAPGGCRPHTVPVVLLKALAVPPASSTSPGFATGSPTGSPRGQLAPILLNAMKPQVTIDQKPQTMLVPLQLQKHPLTVHPSFAPLQNQLQATVELPEVFIEQLRKQMGQAEGLTGKPCRFGRTCKSVDCPNQHKEGREIEDDPQSLVCKFGRKCKRKECFYVHSSGRELDEDQAKGMCMHGDKCNNPGCFFSHPDTRKLITPLKCFNCGGVGHVQADCTEAPGSQRDLPFVKVSNVPEDWVSQGRDTVCKLVGAELEVFGRLSCPPQYSEEDGTVLTAFADTQVAKHAIEAFKDGTVFDIVACEAHERPRPTCRIVPLGRDKSCTVFIGNIPYDAEEEELKDLFSRVGNVESVRLVCEKDSEQPKGFGFCDFTDQATARRAIAELHGHEFKNRRLRVTSAEKALSGQKSANGDDDPSIVLTGFPSQWTLSELSEFIRGASNTIADSPVTMLPRNDETDSGCAKVVFRSEAEANRAWLDLAGQNIAGRSLSVTVVGGGGRPDGRRSERGRGDRRKSRSRSRDKRCTVFVGNIPHGSTEDELSQIFSRAGTVTSFRLVYDKETKTAKGFGFCEYTSPAEAQDAIHDLHGTEINGRRLRVTPAEKALGERSKKGFSETGDQDAEIVVEGLPSGWDSTDMDEFLKIALSSDVSHKSVLILRRNDDQGVGRARVTFGNHSDAKCAWRDLDGQEIDGTVLSVSIDDPLKSRTERAPEGDRPRDKQTVAIHIDELSMPQRPVVEPLACDREVFVDPLPDEDDLANWLSAFGEVEETYRITDQSTGQPGDRGYVKFKDHVAALHCVDSGSASWSESERTLSSQRSRQGGRGSVYPDSVIARILGPRGEFINGLKSEISASMLAIRGDGLGNQDQSMSTRVHFVCKGSPEALSELQPALERALAQIHGELRAKIADLCHARRRSPEQKSSSRSPRRRSRSRRRSTSRGRSRDPRSPPRPPPDLFASHGAPSWDPWFSHGSPQPVAGVWPPQAWVQHQDALLHGASWGRGPPPPHLPPGPWTMPHHGRADSAEWSPAVVPSASSSSATLPLGSSAPPQKAAAAAPTASAAAVGGVRHGNAPPPKRRIREVFRGPRSGCSGSSARSPDAQRPSRSRSLERPRQPSADQRMDEEVAHRRASFVDGFPGRSAKGASPSVLSGGARIPSRRSVFTPPQLQPPGPSAGQTNGYVTSSRLGGGGQGRWTPNVDGPSVDGRSEFESSRAGNISHDCMFRDGATDPEASDLVVGRPSATHSRSPRSSRTGRRSRSRS